MQFPTYVPALLYCKIFVLSTHNSVLTKLRCRVCRLSFVKVKIISPIPRHKSTVKMPHASTLWRGKSIVSTNAVKDFFLILPHLIVSIRRQSTSTGNDVAQNYLARNDVPRYCATNHSAVQARDRTPGTDRSLPRHATVAELEGCQVTL